MWVAALGCWIIITLVSGCSSGSNSKILSKDTMKVVLMEMLKADAYNEFRIMKDTNYRHDTAYALLYADIWDFHHITRQQFSDSYEYYMSKPEDLKALIDSMASDANRTPNIAPGKGAMQGANQGAGRPAFVPGHPPPGAPPGARPGFPPNGPGGRPGFPPGHPGGPPNVHPGFPPNAHPGFPPNGPGGKAGSPPGPAPNHPVPPAAGATPPPTHQ